MCLLPSISVILLQKCTTVFSCGGVVIESEVSVECSLGLIQIPPYLRMMESGIN